MKIPDLRSVIDRALLKSLRMIDAEEAERVRERGCPHCGGRLHRADYPRKPRGVDELEEGDWWRRSFCCAECRRRTTPKSARFLGRKVYLAAAVVVTMLHRARGVTAERVAASLRIALSTIFRWAGWWRDAMPASRWWREARTLIAPPVSETSIVGALYERFRSYIGEGRAALIKLLQFMSPLTVPAGYPT